MAGELVSLVLRGAHGVSTRAKAVLIVLADTCASATAPAFPGVPRIAAMLNTGQRQVRDALAELQAMGWIRQVTGTGHGPGNPAKYLIDFDAMRKPADEFDRSKGSNVIAAKAPDAGRNKAPDAGRNGEGNCALIAPSLRPTWGTVMRPTGGNETKGNETQNYSTCFEDFFKAYPPHRRWAKKQCAALWAGEGLDDHAAEIIAHVNAMAKSNDWSDPTRVPSTLKYLSERRWESGLPPSEDRQWDAEQQRYVRRPMVTPL